MPGPHGGTLNVVGLCAYCDAPTRDTCRLCGTAMCPDHAIEGELVCVGCSRGRVED
ncbi:MAG: hypothetical protein WDA16_12505 [Candidatus Thermoplasmatota archaeon]